METPCQVVLLDSAGSKHELRVEHKAAAGREGFPLIFPSILLSAKKSSKCSDLSSMRDSLMSFDALNNDNRPPPSPWSNATC